MFNTGGKTDATKEMEKSATNISKSFDAMGKSFEKIMKSIDAMSFSPDYDKKKAEFTTLAGDAKTYKTIFEMFAKYVGSTANKPAPLDLMNEFKALFTSLNGAA